MHLSTSEIERFYRIWFPLLHYVNQQRQLVDYFPARWGTESVDTSVARTLRDELWTDDLLREAFIAENPAGLSPLDLALVASWKNRIAGDFFIIRHLKKYTVFLLGGQPTRAYGVLGLVSPLEDVIGTYLPVYVKAVLLPFEGRIIYDSLLSSYNVAFGGGIRRGLNDDFRKVQEHEGIITTLTPDAHADTADRGKHIQARNKRILLAFQTEMGKSGLSPKMMEQHRQAIASFAQEYLLDENPPRGLADLTINDVKAYLNGDRDAHPVSLKRFVRFLRDTDRLDYEQAVSILEILK